MKCWVENTVLANIEAESERCRPKETGGLLLGYWANGDVVITTSTVPGPKSKHSSNSYTPDAIFDRDQVAKVYKKSRGVIAYLGDWHSHPKGGCGLSNDDIITLFNISTYEPARAETPIMLLSVNENSKWIFAAWRNAISPVGDGEYLSHLLPLEIVNFSF
jgi:integrative and conjugative element protein (TIGR02256 family)